MAQRRMFSPNIVDSDAFLDMPSSAQSLYFHLGMRADDDGFVGNPKKVLRMIGGTADDLKILLAKRFLLTFENGVIVIKHWRINNLIRKDWYKETVYVEEKKRLKIKPNGAYTELENNLVNENTTNRQRRLGKVSIDKNTYPNFSSSKKNSLNNSKITTEPEDISEDVSINYNTGEVEDNRPVRKLRSQGKDKVALGLQEYFRVTCKQYTGVLPMKDKAGYFSVLRAMNEATMTEKEIKSMIDDWFEDGQDPGKEVQITACFSNWNINRFKALYQ